MSTDYKQKYEAKRLKKTVSFNTEKEAELLDFANSIADFSGWVKQKLKEELIKSNNHLTG